MIFASLAGRCVQGDNRNLCCSADQVIVTSCSGTPAKIFNKFRLRTKRKQTKELSVFDIPQIFKQYLFWL